MDSGDETESLEDRMLRQILEESLKQSKETEEERVAASEIQFQDQLRAAQEQNRLDQQKRERELEAQAEAELQEQIKQAMEMSAQAEQERFQKSREREELLLKMDREFGSRNQSGGIARSATVASTNTCNARIVETRAPTRSSTMPLPHAGRDTRAPMFRPTRSEWVADRQHPVSSPTVSARTNQPDTHGQCPTQSPSVSSTRAAQGIGHQTPTSSPSILPIRAADETFGRLPSRSSTVSSTRNEHNHRRPISPAGNLRNPNFPGVVLPSFADSRSSSQHRNRGRDQNPDPSPLGNSWTENAELPINNRPELSRRPSSYSTSSRNRPIRQTQGELTKFDEDNDGQRPSNRSQDLDLSITRNTTSPRSLQLERSRTLPAGNRTERKDSRPPDSRPAVSGSRPLSERSSSTPDHLPNKMPLRTVHEGSRNSLRRPILAEYGALGPIRREASLRLRPAEFRIPRSMAQETGPRVTPTHQASPPLPSPRNSAQPGSTGSAYTQRSTTGTPGATLPNERGTTVGLDPGLGTAINNSPSTPTTLTEEELAGLTDEQMLERALSASTETRVLAESSASALEPLDEEELAEMTEEHMLERAMRDSAAMALLDASRLALNLTAAQITELDNEQMQRARDMSRGDDPEEAAKERELDKLMSDLPRYHEIVGTWDEWHEKKKGIEPGLRPRRLPEYTVPSGSELTYVTSWAEEIPLEKAMIISNQNKDEYWNRVEIGEITDTATSQGQETRAERKAKGAQQKAHLKAVAAMPTAKELNERYAQGNPVLQETPPSQETADQDGQGGEGAAIKVVQRAAEGPAHEGGGEGHVQSITQINARRENRNLEQRNNEGAQGNALADASTRQARRGRSRNVRHANRVPQTNAPQNTNGTSQTSAP